MSLLILGDALDNLRIMPSESVDQCATSPPYYLQRDYGVAGQIGREQTLQQYLDRLWAVFDEVKRVLKPEGTCFVDLGDKYLHGSLQLIPEQFAVGMKNRGWIPRNHITWHKLNPKPESVSSRFSNDSEPIYFFVKSRKHHFALQYEPYAKSSIERCERFLKNKETFDPARHKHDPADARQAATSITERVAKNLRIPRQVPNGMHIERNCGQGRENYDDRGRRMRSVWPLSVGRYRGAHFATWPPQLVRRIILAGCPLGGTVLDPFLGSGTTIVIAEDLGCIGIGIDLNATYLALARENILGAREKRATATCSGRKR